MTSTNPILRIAICVCVIGLAACAGGNDGGGDAGPDADTDGDTDTDTDADAGPDGGNGFDYGPMAAAVDAFWGAAPEPDVRLDMFEQMWTYMAWNHAGFVDSPVDWDAVYDYTRPRIEAAESYGRFYQLLAKMFVDIADAHTYIDSMQVCRGDDESYMDSRPPIFLEAYNVDSTYRMGVCVTLTEDDELLVYKVDPENPAGLQPGDRILGYDGEPWSDLLATIDGWQLPHCGRNSAAPFSHAYRRMISVVHNFHLFDALDFVRYGEAATTSVPTEDLLGYHSTVNCTDQLPVAGVEMPWQSTADIDLTDTSNGTTSGVIEGTNIGYVYSYSFYPGADVAFPAAIDAVMGTEGMILDFRFNSGGYASYAYGSLLALTGPDAEAWLLGWERSDNEDYYAMQRWPAADLGFVGDAGGSYDYPIAILLGPKSNSAGETVPYLLRNTHGLVRSFGAATNGAYGFITDVFTPDEDEWCGDVHMRYTPGILTDADENHLNSIDNPPDEEIWLTAEDAIDGVDPVVEAALDWIGSAKN